VNRRWEQQSKGFRLLRQLVNDPINVIFKRNDGRLENNWLWDKSLIQLSDLLKIVIREDWINNLLRQTNRRLYLLEKLLWLCELSLSTLMIYAYGLESQFSRLNLLLLQARKMFIIILGVCHASGI
jgi:CRISPR/Cas system-associated protein Cas10 (large subunit of type III CRISPR-Cas system)